MEFELLTLTYLTCQQLRLQPLQLWTTTIERYQNTLETTVHFEHAQLFAVSFCVLTVPDSSRNSRANIQTSPGVHILKEVMQMRSMLMS